MHPMIVRAMTAAERRDARSDGRPPVGISMIAQDVMAATMATVRVMGRGTDQPQGDDEVRRLMAGYAICNAREGRRHDHRKRADEEQACRERAHHPCLRSISGVPVPCRIANSARAT